MDMFHAELISILIAVITACVGVVTKQVVSYLNKKGVLTQLQSNKELVTLVVKGIEQSYKSLNGDEKLQLAKMELVKLMKDNKIKITEKELDLIIESTVKEVKETVKEETNKK